MYLFIHDGLIMNNLPSCSLFCVHRDYQPKDTLVRVGTIIVYLFTKTNGLEMNEIKTTRVLSNEKLR